MIAISKNNITQMLLAWRSGNTAAVDELLSLVYDELRRVARSYMRNERGNHTLQPTALVNEAYLRLVKQDAVDWQSRAHFFGIAARLMRQVLIEYARSHNAEKRGGGQPHLGLDHLEVGVERDVDLIALDEAIDELERFNTFGCKVVELRFFGGLSLQEIAEVIGVSESTVKREWQMAKAWLLNRLENE